MKIYKLAEEKPDKPDNYDEMKDWFDKRTKKHIERVQSYCKKIEDFDPERFKGLIERGEVHDQSKYKDPEVDPYIYVTWQYKCKDDGKEFECPEGMDEEMDKATEHHVKSNAHHPEYHCEKEVGLINRKDRDKPPEEIIDATDMKELDIAEMVADWVAMGQEKGNSAKDWADKNVNKRWKFTDAQKDLIYELIDVCESE
jgi:hypothetical protein